MLSFIRQPDFFKILMKLIHWHIFSIDIPTQIPKILTTGFKYLNLQHFLKKFLIRYEGYLL